MEYILKVENLSKSFNGIFALEGINFNLRKNEIHGIIGANGSGKSTFMNILFGTKVISETGGYEGDIWLDGQKVKINNTNIAMNHGIGMVHQELSLLGELSISSNIKINRENLKNKTGFFKDFALVDERQNRKDAILSLSKIGVDLNPKIRVKSISTNLKQHVEIAREIDKENLKILILDEPTSSLNIEETKVLLASLKKIADAGLSIIFISHRLNEIAEICHRTSVFRDGKIIRTYCKGDYDLNKMANDMIGKEVVEAVKKKQKFMEMRLC